MEDESLKSATAGSWEPPIGHFFLFLTIPDFSKSLI